MALFEMTEAYQRATDSLLGIVRERGRGGRITHDEIQSKTGIEPYSANWNHLVKLFKNRARRELGIVIWCKTPLGLDILTQAEQIELPAILRTRKMHRQASRAIREVGSTPDAELTMHQRIVKDHTVDSLRSQRRAVRRQARVLESMRPSSAFGFHMTSPPV